MLNLPISIATLLVALSAVYVQAATPKISPRYATLYVLENRGMNMTCTSTSNNVQWKKGNQQATALGFKRSMKADNEPGSQISDVSVTISKTLPTLADSGTYTCSADSEDRNIDVKVFSVEPKNDRYEKNKDSASLACTVSNLDSAVYTMEWTFKGKEIQDDEKYQIISDNNTLIITDPVHKDSGEYFCNIKFPEGMQVITFPINFYAAPYVRKFDKSKNLIEGDPLTLKCEVYSHPPAIISWYKDDNPVDMYNDISVVDDEAMGNKDGILKIPSVNFDDKGVYMCLADNQKFNISSNRTILVRVKDKLAALWPFLGIVAEVIVLCIIIFIYEKKRSRSEEEEDAADAGNCANAADHRGNEEVRQRNVRA